MSMTQKSPEFIRNEFAVNFDFILKMLTLIFMKISTTRSRFLLSIKLPYIFDDNFASWKKIQWMKERKLFWDISMNFHIFPFTREKEVTEKNYKSLFNQKKK